MKEKKRKMERGKETKKWNEKEREREKTVKR